MTEQLLDRTDIRATLQKMGDKGVPQRVRAHRLHHSGPLGSRPGGMLNRSGVQVVTPDSLRPRILRKLIRREQPEPAPFLRRIGILHRKCIRRSSSRPSKKRNSKGEFPISTSKAAPSFVSSRLRVRPWFDMPEASSDWSSGTFAENMKCIAIIILLSYTMYAQADIDAGIRAYNQGNYDTALKEFTAAAEAKDPMGIHLLASLYYQGHGVDKNLDRAVELFTAAAEKGYRGSQANLGLMYQNGDGVKRDIEKAIAYYTVAGKQGDLQSAFNLGQIYRKGDGVEVDHARAAAYYKFAAERGHVPAVNEYGLLFAQGHGVEVDYVEAYGWMSFAAKAGDGQAAKNLAQLKQILGTKLAEGSKRAAEIEASIKR